MSEFDTIIEFKDVSFSYEAIPVLRNASFTIMRNDSVSIVGPNGGGKTTILKLLLGILKPDTGEITILGKSPRKSRALIGYMPQYLQFDRMFPVSVLEVVLMSRLKKGFFSFYSKNDKQVARNALKEMDIEDLGNRPFSDLSGGQQQRVLIARALACEPELLLLDEPTANVDHAVESQFQNILQTLIKKITVVTVSHDLGFVSKIVNRILCVNQYVKIHPASEVTGELMSEMYGGNIKIVRHDHVCSEKGHYHD